MHFLGISNCGVMHEINLGPNKRKILVYLFVVGLDSFNQSASIFFDRAFCHVELMLYFCISMFFDWSLYQLF